MKILKYIAYSLLSLCFTSCKTTPLEVIESYSTANTYADYIMVNDTLIVYSDMFSDFLIEGTHKSVKDIFKPLGYWPYDDIYPPFWLSFEKGKDVIVFQGSQHKEGVYYLLCAYISDYSFPLFPLQIGEKKLSVLKKLMLPQKLYDDVTHIIIVSPDICLSSDYEIIGNKHQKGTTGYSDVDAIYISFNKKNSISAILASFTSDENLFHPFREFIY